MGYCTHYSYKCRGAGTESSFSLRCDRLSRWPLQAMFFRVPFELTSASVQHLCQSAAYPTKFDYSAVSEWSSLLLTEMTLMGLYLLLYVSASMYDVPFTIVRAKLY